MNRADMILRLNEVREWDVCVIGGGATGLGVAIDAASRGLNTILVEQHDFAKGTSSRSTKLVHGGVRYLQQGNIKLVTEALRERGLLKNNAAHLVKNQSFIVPNYKWWEGAFYGIGLKIYDWMAGSLGLGPSQFLSRDETLAMAPTLEEEGLRGAVLYHDGQFDDARLAINMCTTAAEQGAVVINYFAVTGLLKNGSKVSGVHCKDVFSNEEYDLHAKTVINATGVFTDAIRTMDDPASAPLVAPSQGIHLVFEKDFLPGDAAILVPNTTDGRVLFAVPWHHKLIVGTTDTPLTKIDLEPRALEEEIELVLNNIANYLSRPPVASDIKSMFAGLRPLVKGDAKSTAGLSRDHLIQVGASGLITVTGGKWTTYRRMAEDTVNVAMETGSLRGRDCITPDLKIHGWMEVKDFSTDDYFYGSDLEIIHKMIAVDPALDALIHPMLPVKKAQIKFSVEQEMCMTVEDALARRTRCLLLDARSSIEAAPLVAKMMAVWLHKDEQWIASQVAEFTSVANYYVVVV